MDNILESLKTLLTTFLVRWILKIGGTVLATAGISESSLYEVIGGIVMIVIGMVWSWFSHQKALNTPVK